MQVYVARQPIFEKSQKVYGYELLFRNGLENNLYDATDGDQATSSVLSNSFHTIGMDTLTNGKPAFINFTRNLLIDEIATAFPKNLVKVEILETVQPDEAVLNACSKLKKAGYTLVLDDFILAADIEPLIALADIIKVDFLITRGKERSKIMEKIGDDNIQFLAEKVETVDDYKQALKCGYEYFQGYFFSKPVIISGRELAGYKQTYLHMLSAIHNPNIEFAELESIIKHDVSVSYKLLNYINSAFFGLPSKIRSIKHAIAMLGLTEVKKWLSVIALSQIGRHKTEALLTTSLIRANFCELLAPKVGLDKSECFITGLFSIIDAFLDRPLESILAKLPLSDDIKAALSGEGNAIRRLLDVVIAYEKGKWEECQTLASRFVEEDDLPQAYFEAVEDAMTYSLYGSDSQSSKIANSGLYEAQLR